MGIQSTSGRPRFSHPLRSRAEEYRQNIRVFTLRQVSRQLTDAGLDYGPQTMKRWVDAPSRQRKVVHAEHG